MKKTIKLILACSFIFCTFVYSAQGTKILANEQLQPDIFTLEENSETLYFYSYEDYQGYLNMKRETENVSTRSNVGVTRKDTIIYEKVIPNQWIGYHSATPNWTKASNYTLTISETYTAGGSVSTDGYSFSVSVSYTQGATTTIPADSSKFSRLSIRADVRLIRTKRELYRYGKLESTYYTNTGTAVNRYVVVKYK